MASNASEQEDLASKSNSQEQNSSNAEPSTSSQQNASSATTVTSTASAWWGSFIKSAKEKSLSALEIMKTDLAEFTSTMTHDTQSLINQASAQLKETNIVSSTSIDFTRKFSTETTDNKNNTATSSGSSSIHDRYLQELKLLQSNESTFLNDVTDIEEFNSWASNFNTDNYKAQISDLLIENSAMRLIYSQLVPAQISNNQFWSRYFYKVNQIEEEHKKRVKLLERSTNDELFKKEEEESSLDWGEDDSLNTSSPVKTSDISASIITIPAEEISTTNDDQSNAADSVVEEQQSNQDKSLKQEPTNVEKISEDSDEWEKVSDVSNGVINESIKTANSKTEIKPEEESNSANKDDKPDEVKPKEANNSEKNKTDGKSPNDGDWDEWDE